MAAPFRTVGEGVAVAVRVTPRARRNAVEGTAATADGGTELRIAVTAAPEGGKANAAVIRLLARAWALPKSALSVTRGAADRHKTILVTGDPADLARRLADWLATIER